LSAANMVLAIESFGIAARGETSITQNNALYRGLGLAIIR